MSLLFAPRFFAPEIRSALRLLDEPIFRAPAFGRFVAEGARGPAINLEEGKEAYLLDAEVPGYKREDLTIEFKEDEHQVLVISGKRGTKVNEPVDVDKESATSEPSSTSWLRERATEGFTRSFRLPERINLEGVRAQLADGLLHLELPKSAKPEPKTITIE